MSYISIGGTGHNSEMNSLLVDAMRAKISSDNISQVDSLKEIKLAELHGSPIPVGEEHLIKVIERANKALQGAATSFEFSIHEKTKEIMVKVFDKNTGEMIREIPNHKILDMIAKMWEMAGIVIDERR